MKVLVTGSALVLRLLERGDEVTGVDNHYYSLQLKKVRLARHIEPPNYTHIRGSLVGRSLVESLFKCLKPHRMVNLAAQADVRYSIEPSLGYILEGCRHNNVEHLVYASFSSVYGSNAKMLFSVYDNVKHPLVFNAATKKRVN